jgi:serine/threonine protein phosphatase 1
MSRFVVGDIHGNYKGLRQALGFAGFDPEDDLLISLGDIADGFPEVPDVIEYFMGIKNLIWCLGNHDKWAQDWFAGKLYMKHVGPNGEFDHPLLDTEAHVWLSQGGKATYNAYIQRPELIIKHEKFWSEKPQLSYESGDMKLFLHAGYHQGIGLHETIRRLPHFIYWDRSFFSNARLLGESFNIEPYQKVYIGHTSTTYFGIKTPIHTGKVWNMDTGAGREGCISVMNIDTEEIFQSQEAEIFYPNFRPRG